MRQRPLLCCFAAPPHGIGMLWHGAAVPATCFREREGRFYARHLAMPQNSGRRCLAHVSSLLLQLLDLRPSTFTAARS